MNIYRDGDSWFLEANGLRWTSPYHHEVEYHSWALKTGHWVIGLAERIDRPGTLVTKGDLLIESRRWRDIGD